MHHGIFSEREVWSPRHLVWSNFRVIRPRLPSEQDLAVSFGEVATPKYLSDFVGSHLNEVMKSLRSYRENFESDRNLPDALLVYGSTGKTAILHAFQSELKELYSSPSWMLQIDVRKHLDRIPALISQIHHFVSNEIKSKLALPYRVVVLQHLDEMSPSEQQSLKKTMDAHESKAKYFFVASDKLKIIESIRNKCNSHRVKQISVKDAINVVLNFCFQHNIGYELGGIKELFHRSNIDNKRIHLREIFRILQDCFLRKFYISAENVKFVVGAVNEPILIPLAKARLRCSICTLYPPCKHIAENDVIASNRIHRRSLPKNSNAEICISFRNTGYCSSFDYRGRCWFAHSSNLHELIPPIERCTQCTIPWVCDHCAFNVARQSLKSLLEEISRRQVRMKILLSPEPPTSIVNPIQTRYPDFKEHLEAIQDEFIRFDNQKMLERTSAWMQNTRSVEKAEYEECVGNLEASFSEFVHTPILHVSDSH